MEAWLIVGLILLVVAGGLFVVALTVEPMRKAIGLVLIVLGFLACLTVAGIIIGIPMMLIGGFFVFY